MLFINTLKIVIVGFSISILLYMRLYENNQLSSDNTNSTSGRICLWYLITLSIKAKVINAQKRLNVDRVLAYIATSFCS